MKGWKEKGDQGERGKGVEGEGGGGRRGWREKGVEGEGRPVKSHYLVVCHTLNHTLTHQRCSFHTLFLKWIIDVWKTIPSLVCDLCKSTAIL